jgi:hypothetical protein
MEILVALATAAGINFAVIGGSIAYFKRLFISEEKFHVLTAGGQVRVVQGKRRTPLKLSEAEAHLATVNRIARRSGWQWMLTYWSLFGPKNTRVVDTALDKVRRNAIESQRNKLLVEAMNSGYSETSLMATIMKVSTDKHFEKIRKAIAVSTSKEVLALAGTIEGELRKDNELDGKEIVLIEIGRVKNPTKAITGTGNGGVNLPEGYAWDIKWKARGGEFEEMVVVLKAPSGKVIASDGFYTSIWGTPDRQKEKVRKIQKELAYQARHDMDPSGVAPEIRALL